MFAVMSAATSAIDASPSFLSGGGLAGELARAIDWSRTPLGPPAAWPGSLRTVVGLILNSRHPMFLWWGPELIQFYNDAYLPSFGQGKHPAAMGQPGRDCWQEIWPIIWPQIDDVMARRKPSWNEDALVPIFRNGRMEEVYWTYGYSPVIDEAGAVGGTLVVCTETTARVIAARRSNTLRVLGEKSTWATDAGSFLRHVASALGEASSDVPFALIYFRDQAGTEFRLAQAAGLKDAAAEASLAERVRPLLLVHDDQPGPALAIPIPIDPAGLPGGPWPEPSRSIHIVPLGKGAPGRPFGFVVFGLGPRLSFDEAYRVHLEQLADQISLGLSRIDALKTHEVLERGHAEREKLLADLESAGRAKDEFLAMLGHELRNPLSPIVTALQLMKLRGDATTTREQQVIERQVEHLVRLVDDLLDISKITRGKVELRREIVEIAEVIAKAVEMASMLFEQRSHLLSIDVPRKDLLWEGDPVRLAQVVANLLTNAARYTPRGGDIKLFAGRVGSEIVIRVRDNGMGISAEMLPRIFDLFVQGKQSADRAEGGLGIGLTLVKTLVSLHGGSVVATSPGLGGGSEFVIRLPAAPAAAVGISAAHNGAPPRFTPAEATRRVLLVDDNLDAADLLAEALREAGHQVEVANDPVVALEAAARFHPEVAILDIGLPVMDGYELAARLQALPALASCRLIALTGYGQDHDRARSRSGGFECHLVKPVDLDKLMSLVAEPARAAG
jgi:signal transduction histidine kinase/CheY-like chemotaxis protein